jgi:replicative DNA helicase Mcm
MSQAQDTPADEHDYLAFWRRYYADEVELLAQRYPKEQQHIEIDWSDLLTYDVDLAEDYLKAPDVVGEELEAALRDYPTPNVTLSDVDVRVVGLNESSIYSPLEVTRDDGDRDEAYVGVRGELAKVTEPKKEIQEAAFECQRCGTMTYVPQSGEGFDEPHECQGCERQGPFSVVHGQSTFHHHAKIRIETPPDERGDLQNEAMDADVRGDLVWTGGNDFGLLTRSGESVVVYGTVEQQQITDGRTKTRHFEDYLDVSAIEFDADEDDIQIAEHRDEFETLAEREEAVDLFAESIVPELYQTPEWEHALELLVAYLFGAPRIDVPDGPTYRGDIHALIVSDYGMGKSMVNSAVAMYSPKCIKESVTGMSSDVGLLAAAVEDDFGDNQWTLQPGILVRANGGHVILDEIDKTDVDLERMNDALEGEQMVDVNKAGQQATFKSRVGLLATGNPEDSRFTAEVPVSQELNIDQSLLSRFDGIVTMRDEADETQDGFIAETQGMSYVEAQEYVHGDREEMELLSREVEPDVGRAWIAEARENVTPQLQPRHVETIREWYAEEVRQLNEKFRNNEAGDMPVPVSARKVQDTIRFAVAFARVHLRDEVADVDVERAMELSKALVGGTFDGDRFQPEAVRSTPTTQEERIDGVKEALQDADDPLTPAQVGERLGIDEDKAEQQLESLARDGRAMCPQTGVYRLV